MASVTEQLTPAGQGNLQQIKAGKPIFHDFLEEKGLA